MLIKVLGLDEVARGWRTRVAATSLFGVGSLTTIIATVPIIMFVIVGPVVVTAARRCTLPTIVVVVIELPNYLM